ncbi:hypothetical protein ESCO_002898 [Escovopsis weberi]|uniref:SH3 domain-containing protein n=1 Tax=Escovopsis weberi TaxID=150374 RepID=A0A0M9VS81_ESCWE|nr:hypothetical protein ESCO_002898 [Escovopsis weberi]
MALTPGIALTTDPYDRSESANSANPFGFYAERIPTPIHEEDEDRADSPSLTASPRDLTSDRYLVPEPPAQKDHFAGLVDGAEDGVAGAAAGLGAATARSSFARKASMRSQNPNQIDLTMPAGQQASSVGAESGSLQDAKRHISSPSVGAAAIAAAGGPANSTVHRVQLSFKPSLTDELEINAGDLIRLLHEYDDGWVSP